MVKKIPPWLLRVAAVLLITPLIYLTWEKSQQVEDTALDHGNEVSAVRVGTQAADFKVSGPFVGNKKSFQLSTVKGTPIILHFWATWCTPCVYELPELIKLGERARAKGFTLIAVAIDDDWETVDRFFTRHPKLASLRDVSVLILDPQGTVANLYNVSRFPETLLINRSFVIDNKLVGPQPWLSKDMWRYLDRLQPNEEPL